MINRLVQIIVSFLLLSTPLVAQDHSDRYSFEFRGAALADVLEQVVKETGIDMVYDPNLVNGITIYKRIHNLPVPDLLRKILSETSLDFLTLSSGTIVIVKTVNDNPAFGSYLGKVIDSQTGRPLPGATVLFADATGGTSTGPSGAFSINKLVTGHYKIIFSYVGYEPVYKTIEIKPDQTLQEEVSLKPKPVDFTPIVVTGHIPQLPYQNGNTQSVDPANLLEPTGRLQDAIRSLSLFPGVQYGLPMTDFHLQGGHRGEHRILLDGVPVYNPYSFGQMFSAFSAFAINKVELYKAGYDVSHGSQIAGLIDLSHDISSVNQNGFLMQGDPLSLNLRGDLHFPGNNPEDNSALKIMTAARSNYWDIYKEPTLDNTLREWDNLDPLITNLLIDSEVDAFLYEPREHHSDVRFYDIHLASMYEIDSYNTLSSSFYLGKNYVSTNLLRQAPQRDQSPQYLYARDEYLWRNLMGQITYNRLVSPRLDLSSQISFSSNRLNHRYLIGTSNTPAIPDLNIGASFVYQDFLAAEASNQLPNQRNANRINHFIFRTDGRYSFTPYFNLEGGVQLDFVESLVDLTDLFYLPTLSDQRSTFASSYLNGNWRMGEYWKLTLGNRITLVHPSNRFYPELRTGVQFDHPDSGIGYWSAKLSGGLYRQFINQYEITNPGPTSLVPSFTVWSHAGTSETPKAWHLSGSFYLEPDEQTTVNLELFQKWQPTTYTVSYDNLLKGIAVDRSGFNAFAETTEMRTFGAGLRLNRSLAGSKVKVMFGYDYSFSRIKLGTQFGRTLPTHWNEPHRFQFRALWRVLPDFSAVAKWKSVLGRSWGFRQAYYNYLLIEGNKNVGGFSFTHPEYDRLRPFHQLDVSLIYKPSWKFADLEVRLDLINLLNRRNTIDWSLRPISTGAEQYEISERTMPGFSPSISLQAQF